MKKTLILLLAVLMTLVVASIAAAYDDKPTVYADFGFGDSFTGKVNASNNDSIDDHDKYKINNDGDFHAYLLGFEYPIKNWKFGFEFENISNFDTKWTINGEHENFAAHHMEKPEFNLSMENFKAGYRVVNTEHFNLYVNGEYLRNSAKSRTDYEDGYGEDVKGKVNTSSLIVGPELQYQINRFSIDGFIGCGLLNSQKMKNFDGGVDDKWHSARSIDTGVASLKFGYMFTDNVGMDLGYRGYWNSSKYKYHDEDGFIQKDKIDDSVNYLTLGVVFKF